MGCEGDPFRPASPQGPAPSILKRGKAIPPSLLKSHPVTKQKGGEGCSPLLESPAFNAAAATPKSSGQKRVGGMQRRLCDLNQVTLSLHLPMEEDQIPFPLGKTAVKVNK